VDLAPAGDLRSEDPLRRSSGLRRTYTVMIRGSARDQEFPSALSVVGRGIGHGRGMVHDAPFGSTTRSNSKRGRVARRTSVRTPPIVRGQDVQKPTEFTRSSTRKLSECKG
jgi:hypothetical protein